LQNRKLRFVKRPCSHGGSGDEIAKFLFDLPAIDQVIATRHQIDCVAYQNGKQGGILSEIDKNKSSNAPSNVDRRDREFGPRIPQTLVVQ
jgi:hypothetical protein